MLQISIGAGDDDRYFPSVVCVCICMCMYVYVCVCVCMYVYICVCMCIYVYMCMCMYVYVYDIYMYVCVCMCMHVYVCMCIYVCVYIYVCMCMYVYVCVYMCMYHNYLKVSINCRYIFCGFGFLCILLVLNFAWATRLMIFMMVYSQYLISTSIKFCTFVEIRRNIKR